MEISNKLIIPAFGNQPAVTFDLSKTKEAEDRLHEAKSVNPSTYSDLEFCYNESYRELKKVLANVGFQLTIAEKVLKAAKSEALLDKYPDFLTEQIKKYPEEMRRRAKDIDSTQVREAFINRDEEVIKATDRISTLKAFDAIFDGKIKTMERTCGYMKKEMDIVIRSGSVYSNKNQ